jgi:hypothetical protein
VSVSLLWLERRGKTRLFKDFFTESFSSPFYPRRYKKEGMSYEWSRSSEPLDYLHWASPWGNEKQGKQSDYPPGWGCVGASQCCSESCEVLLVMSVSAVENAKTIKVRGSWDVLLKGLCFSVVNMMGS